MSDDTALADVSAQGDAISVVTFEIGPQSYGLPLDAVQEIVRLPALLTVAGAPAHLAGLLNLRGQHLPVLDGYALLGEAPTYGLGSQIMLLSADAGDRQQDVTLGLLVDKVCSVATFRREQLSPVGPQAAPFLQAVAAAMPDVTLLDVAALRELAGL